MVKNVNFDFKHFIITVASIVQMSYNPVDFVLKTPLKMQNSAESE
jgi:hypothetical protein